MRSCTTIADLKTWAGLSAHTRKNKDLDDLRKLGNSNEKKWKAQTRALYPVFSLKIRFYSYLVESSQKATLNFYFKSGFSVKPSKFQIYLANDCSSSNSFNVFFAHQCHVNFKYFLKSLINLLQSFLLRLFFF